MKLSSQKRSRSRHLELSMTSMIDVVFLLLIFFMATSSFVLTERELDPAIQVNRQQAGEQSDLEPAIVEVTRGEGGFVYRLGGREFASADNLTQVLRQFENKHQGAFVRVGDEAPFAMAAAAVQACKSAGYPAVSYLPAN